MAGDPWSWSAPIRLFGDQGNPVTQNVG